MSGGRADFVRLRPWDLAVDTFVHGAGHIRALLVIAALPELARITMFFAYDAVQRMGGFGWWVPPSWITIVLSNVITAVVFTGVIRYVACTDGPYWLPARALLRHYLLSIVVLAGLWVVVAFAANEVFSKVYLGFLDPFDKTQGFWLGKAYDWNYFVISALVIAAFYPGLGMTAVLGRFDLRRLLRWWRKYFLRFLVLAALLMSVCLLLRRVYLWLLDKFLPGLAQDISFLDRETLRSLMMQLIEVPTDILFDIVPAVAIGLLFRVLRANSADL